jgi:hypothetical protein
MNVLALGVYRTDVPSLVRNICAELALSNAVTQRWQAAVAPKFVMINRMLTSGYADFDYLLVVDDDVELCDGFVDKYLALVEEADLALAQPARTPTSTIHHPVVRQIVGSRVRRTRFVEIGPVFSIRRDLFGALLPFDEESPMGWGYDYVWPRVVAGAGLRMGIVDATPVAHAFRPAISYDISRAAHQMAQYLLRHEHLSREEAYS